MCTARLTPASWKTLHFDWRAATSVILCKGPLNRHLSDRCLISHFVTVFLMHSYFYVLALAIYCHLLWFYLGFVLFLFIVSCEALCDCLWEVLYSKLTLLTLLTGNVKLPSSLASVTANVELERSVRLRSLQIDENTPFPIHFLRDPLRDPAAKVYSTSSDSFHHSLVQCLKLSLAQLFGRRSQRWAAAASHVSWQSNTNVILQTIGLLR